MTVIIKLGRRIPRNFYKRMMYKTAGLLSFQENIWLMICRAFQMSKNAADRNPDKNVSISIKSVDEAEDLHYVIQWKIVTVSSIFKEKELEEYNAAMQMYDRFSVMKTLLNKKVESNDEFKRVFRSKFISPEEFEKAKEAGFGALSDKNIANKLLELGIFTVISKDW